MALEKFSNKEKDRQTDVSKEGQTNGKRRMMIEDT
jgi:hypothetical protein